MPPPHESLRTMALDDVLGINPRVGQRAWIRLGRSAQHKSDNIRGTLEVRLATNTQRSSFEL